MMRVTPSLGNIRDIATAVRSAQTVLFLYYYFSLYHIDLIFFNYCHYCKTKIAIWVGINSINWGAALLGGISATIGLRINPSLFIITSIRVVDFAAGRAGGAPPRKC
jgi:hypothetical protein